MLAGGREEEGGKRRKEAEIQRQVERRGVQISQHTADSPPPPPPLLGVSSSPGSHPSPLIFSQVTAEDMEAYRMKRSHHEDPMKDFLH